MHARRWASSSRIFCRLTRSSSLPAALPAARSERIEECDEVLLLLLGEPHLKPDVVEIHGFAQRRRGAVVEVGCAGGEATQDRAFDAIEVAATPRDEGAGGVGRVERGGLAGLERVRAA